MKNPEFEVAPGALAQIFTETIYSLASEHPNSTQGNDVHSQPAETTSNQPKDTAQGAIEKISYKFKGGNNRQILILCGGTSSDIPKPDIDFLSKILPAIKVTGKDVAILNPKDESFNINKAEMAIESVLLFGVNPFEIGIHDATFNLYEIKEWQGKRILLGDTLSVLSNNQDKKKALWINLQRLYL